MVHKKFYGGGIFSKDGIVRKEFHGEISQSEFYGGDCLTLEVISMEKFSMREGTFQEVWARFIGIIWKKKSENAYKKCFQLKVRGKIKAQMNKNCSAYEKGLPPLQYLTLYAKDWPFVPTL